ncbi:unnamed protein product [Linum tenue]|uniref:Uncharacterized protein n=1 Tax=Linum tenue TaxID=586396 RepID=A0AAV0HNE7_9ROSI|nr:unnamed protein product [Linum tenue]
MGDAVSMSVVIPRPGRAATGENCYDDDGYEDGGWRMGRVGDWGKRRVAKQSFHPSKFQFLLYFVN